MLKIVLCLLYLLYLPNVKLFVHFSLEMKKEITKVTWSEL